MKQAVIGEIPNVRPPNALIVDPGDGKAYLDWNIALAEKPQGYLVYRQEGNEYIQITKQPLPQPGFVDQGLTNGKSYTYLVTVVAEDGQESPPSNAVTVTPRLIKEPHIEEGEVILRIPGHRPILLDDALTITFENGQRMVFDKLQMRLRDWTNEAGRHLVYPEIYGNPLDLTELNNWGYHTPKPATHDYPVSPEPITPNYCDFSTKHHYHRGMADWHGYSVQDGRVTIYYTLPMKAGIVDRHTRLKVWETWYAAEKNLSGTVYKGLYRKIELQVPSFFNQGYSVCLNEAFGINGSCQNAITYDLQWDTPYLDEVHWSNGTDIISHKRNPIRRTLEYRPSLYALQVQPYLLINFPQGTYLLSARRYDYSITYTLSNYVAFDRDGIWPNYMVDCAANGVRFAVDTFEYLFAEDNDVKAPQLFMDAAMHYRHNLAHLYQLDPYLRSVNYGWAFLDHWSREFQNNYGDYELMMKAVEVHQRKPPYQYRTPLDLPDNLDELKDYAQFKAKEAERLHMDLVGGAVGLYFTTPYAVDPQILLDINHPVNQAIKAYVEEFTKRGIRVSYWMRPDFIKTGTANVLSDKFIERYMMYVMMKFPAIREKLEQEGLALIREHPDWLKRGRDGNLPNFEIDYCELWTPVSYASGYYDEVLIPTIKMMRQLGFTTIFEDGLFSVMSGIDYRDGKALPNMPYLWRWLQDAGRMGLDFNGECLLGFGNNTVPTPAEVDAANMWALIHSNFRGDLEAEWVGPRLRYIAYSLYIGAYMTMESTAEQAAVSKFAQDFLQKNGHPDRVYLENLRWDFLDESGRSAVRGWIWDKVYWEYKDGHRVYYPTYAEYLSTDTTKAQQLKDAKTEMDRSTGNTLPGKADTYSHG